MPAFDHGLLTIDEADLALLIYRSMSRFNDPRMGDTSTHPAPPIYKQIACDILRDPGLRLAIHEMTRGE